MDCYHIDMFESEENSLITANETADDSIMALCPIPFN